MDIRPHLDNYEWCSDTMWPSITGLPVYTIMHTKDGFISQEVPILSVKVHSFGDERDYDDFTWVTVEDEPIDVNLRLDAYTFKKVKQFIRINKTVLCLFWDQLDINIGSIRDLVVPIDVNE